MGTWKMLVFAVGLLVTWALYERGVRGALLIGIVGATVLATVSMRSTATRSGPTARPGYPTAPG